jgi:hypothetical protein
MFEHQVSGEAVERLEVWIAEHCPGALDDPQFLPGLIVVIAEEVRQELHRVCWMRLRQLREPCGS